MVQWFERERFELHTENRGTPYEVELGRLGAEALTQQGRDWLTFLKASPQTPHYAAETGHAITPQFWDYWRSHGLEFGDSGISYRESLALFGYPLSEAQMERGADGQMYLTQYFERARFEWHPELPVGARVQLGQQGRRYLEATNVAPQAALAPVSGAAQAWGGVRPTRIRIPRVTLDAAIVEGGFALRSWDVPRYDAVHYWPVAAFPATPGNIVIAGHAGYKDTIFNHLPDATHGDEIALSIGQVERRYRVTEIWTVGPDDAWVMAPLPRETLTLITCVPIGIYSHRLIVRAMPSEP